MNLTDLFILHQPTVFVNTFFEISRIFMAELRCMLERLPPKDAICAPVCHRCAAGRSGEEAQIPQAAPCMRSEHMNMRSIRSQPKVQQRESLHPLLV